MVEVRKIVQSGVLPYRIRRDGSPEVLLVTARQSGRWTIPKGGVAAGLSLRASAAKEAHEEAGVRGIVSKTAAAIYNAVKRDGAAQILLEVVVYLLQVEVEDKDHKEKGVRERRWCSTEEAARRLNEPILSELCRKLAAARSAA